MKNYDESEDPKHSDTEITLGVKSILGIFFALALICGVFFGFGYSLGRGNGPKAAVTQSSQQLAAASAPDVKTIVEPGSGSQAKPEAGEAAAPPSLNAATSVTPAAPAQPVLSPTPQPAAATTPAQPVPATYSLPASAPANIPASIMVQIAAVAHRDDADVLVTALQQRGYHASVRTDPGDSLLHIQIGPFATRNQAKAMQARLLNDGYNAILK